MTKHKIDGREYHSYDTVFWDTEVIPRATLKSHTGDRREDEAIAKAQRMHDEDVADYLKVEGT